MDLVPVRTSVVPKAAGPQLRSAVASFRSIGMLSPVTTQPGLVRHIDATHAALAEESLDLEATLEHSPDERVRLGLHWHPRGG